MIPGLNAYAREYQLTVAANLVGATIGVSAELLANLTPAEIVARLRGTASGSGEAAPGQAPSTPGSDAQPAATATDTAPKFVVVFDGPGRATTSRLDDGLQRRRVMRTLLEAGVPFLVAPALAAAQLAYLYENKFVSHVAGADESLLWADVPLVLGLFSEAPQLLFRHALLAHLRLGETAFTEIAVGVGRNAVIDQQLPLLDHVGNPIESAVRIAIQHGGPAPPPPPGSTGPPPPSISVYRAAVQACDPAYIAAIQRALTFVARQPTIAADGTVVLHNKTAQPIPNDLADVIGVQLAPGIYWYLGRGILGPELLRGAMWGTFSDCWRVARTNAELHAEFSRLQGLLSPIRQQAYSLLVSQLHRYFHVKEVVNRTDGAANFKRTAPQLPNLTPNPTVESVVSDAVAHAREVAALDDLPVNDLPIELARRAVSKSTDPAPVLVRAASLALRELVESVVCWFMATGKVPLSIDTEKLVLAMPWVPST